MVGGWIGGCIDRWKDGVVGGCIAGWMDGWLDVLVGGWIGGYELVGCWIGWWMDVERTSVLSIPYSMCAY